MNYYEVNSTEPHWWEVSIGLGNGFGAIRHQAIIWTNVDLVQHHLMASLDHNELNAHAHENVNKICLFEMIQYLKG